MSPRVPAVLGLALLGVLIAAAVRAPRAARAQEEAAPPAEEQGAPDGQLARFQERAEGSGDPRDWYNLGTAYLAAERWPEARPELARAADEGGGKVRRFSRYNLGVANAMEGRPEGSPPEQERRERLIAARDAFREVLREDPEDPSARWNLELVNRWLEEMSSGGGGANQDEEDPQGGTSGSAGQQGPAEPGGQAPSLSREEAERLLQQAAGAEDEVRDKTLRRGRLRDPIVQRNW